MTANVDQVAPEVARAAALAGKLQLATIQRMSIRAELVSVEEPEALRYELGKVAVLWHQREGAVSGLLPLSLQIFSDRTQGEPLRLAEISVLFRVEYLAQAGSTPESLEGVADFLGISGYMHVWPYFRADVQQLTMTLGFPGLTLPLVLSGEVPARVTVASKSLSPKIASGSDLPPPLPEKNRRRRTQPT